MTFILHNGKFRYMVLPMGLSPSSDSFNRKTDMAVQGLEGVRKLVDNRLAADGETRSWRNVWRCCSSI